MTEKTAINRPFPFESGLRFGHKPDFPQNVLNSYCAEFYEKWKDEYLCASQSYEGCWFISTGGGTNVDEAAITVSEGHGYGMITVVLMAGYDSDAKEIFDGMVRFFLEHRSSVSETLPSWQVLGKVGSHETCDRFASATDGDLDVAYALFLADKQWGSDGKYNYRSIALDMCDSILEFDVHEVNHRVLLGDWVPGEETDEKYRSATRPSDWMPAHFRLFRAESGNPTWERVVDTIYSLAAAVAHTETGLLPDFVVDTPPKAAEPHFLENFSDGSYGANACRVPWRVGMDMIHFGSDESKGVILNIMQWLMKESGGTVHGIMNGYFLNGVPLFENNIAPRGMYAAPFMVASTCSADYVGFLNNSWNYLVKFKGEEGYYSNSITMLCLLAVSGNWWNPADPF